METVLKAVRRLWLAVVAGAVMTAACAGPPPPADLAPDEIETTLFLIGDAGEPDPRGIGAPLDSMAAQAAEAPERSVILYLGDNVYPDGIPREGAAEWADARRRLAAQVLAVPPGARGIFVPGNHDWASSGPFGLYAIRLQEEMIAQLAEGRDVVQLPSNGCPGPSVVDTGRLRLVLLDTQWWLHDYIVHDADSDCTDDPAVVTAELRDAVRPRFEGQLVIVAAHHPLMSGGKHGGYCGITGPYNRFGGQNQDIISTANRIMRDSLESAFVEDPPFAYVAGHDHNLQVLRGGRVAGHLLVSGAGSHSRVTCAVRLRESRYVSQNRSGFMRVDILRGGGVLLSVFRYKRDGTGGRGHTQWLEPR